MVDLIYRNKIIRLIFAASVLLARGATFKKATVKNAFLGLVLFHALFINLTSRKLLLNIVSLGNCEM